MLAGETGNFKSDEALKAMAVAARTFAMHFGSRHALDGFDFCDTTHCQDLRIAGIDAHLRSIAEATAGEILWYDGEPAATYYAANCGGTSEDGRFILGNDEARAPYLHQHSDQYCVRNGGTQWRSEVSKRDLQRALAADGIVVPGTLRSVTVLHRTPSGRVEFLRVTGSSSVTVSALNFRSAIGHNIGWDRLKSNLYDVSDDGTASCFMAAAQDTALAFARWAPKSWARKATLTARSSPSIIRALSSASAHKAFPGSSSPTKMWSCSPRSPSMTAPCSAWLLATCTSPRRAQDSFIALRHG